MNAGALGATVSIVKLAGSLSVALPCASVLMTLRV